MGFRTLRRIWEHYWEVESTRLWQLGIYIFIGILAYLLDILPAYLFVLLVWFYVSWTLRVYRLSHNIKQRSNKMIYWQKGRWGQLNHMLYQIKRRQEKRVEGLKNQVQLLEHSLDHMTQAVVIINKDCTIQWANHQASKLLGIKNRQDRGRNLFHLVRHPMAEQLYLRSHDEGRAIISSPVKPQTQLLVEFQRTEEGQDTAIFIEAGTILQHRRNTAHIMEVLATILDVEKSPNLSSQARMLLPETLRQAAYLQNLRDDFESKDYDCYEVLNKVVIRLKDTLESWGIHQVAINHHPKVQPNFSKEALSLMVLALFGNLFCQEQKPYEVELYWGRSFSSAQLSLTFGLKDVVMADDASGLLFNPLLALVTHQVGGSVQHQILSTGHIRLRVTLPSQSIREKSLDSSKRKAAKAF